MPRKKKITFGEMREAVIFVNLIFRNYRCNDSMTPRTDHSADHVRLLDVEPQFVCRHAAIAVPILSRLTRRKTKASLATRKKGRFLDQSAELA